MIGRFCLLLLSAAACGSAMAQGSQAEQARQMIVQAISGMGGNMAATVTVDGTEAFGDLTVPIRVEAVIEKTMAPGAHSSRLQVLAWRDNRPLHRLVGDGSLLWSWSARRNEYSSALYQFDGQSQGDEVARMLGLAVRWAPREADFAVRFLREIQLLPSNAHEVWTPWVSSAAAVNVDIGGDEKSAAIAYRSIDGATLTYSLIRADTDAPWQLQQVDYDKVSMVRGRVEQIRWTATVVLGFVPTTVNYQFVPPAGARPRSIGI